ncbi:hypothetical protein [Corynebacterium pseudogenitalium]|uniref:Or membrane protein n=1 Tax=Corynebacterium pseudogenitalium TaxID=38303 RepID=A0ABD4TND9_9CORY|nr:hypothetical protein [Corynebacterium pseudogenitalium]MCQ4613397.1 hypothetical protein [Corynebacterium pseudogenitalium]
MRNFRKAALAGATAVAVAFGSATVAIADEAKITETTVSHPTEVVEVKDAEGSLSSKIGKGLGAWEPTKDGKVQKNGADGREIFGSSKDKFGKQPVWAQIGYVLTVFTSVAAAVGLIVGPAYNFVVHGLPAMNK